MPVYLYVLPLFYRDAYVYKCYTLHICVYMLYITYICYREVYMYALYNALAQV